MIHAAFISTMAFNYFFPGEVKRAGGDIRIANLSKRFATLSDYRVSCVVGDFGQPDIIEKERVRLIKAPIDNPKGFFSVLSTLQKINADVYIDFCASPRLMLLSLLKKITRSHYIFLTAHDNDVTGGYRYVENTLFYWAYIYGLRRADAIICQVQDHVTHLRNNYNLSSHLVLSPYFDILPRTEIKEKNQILWVGRAASYKNPQAFISLAEKFPEQSFVMICNDSKYDNGFMASINKKLSSINNLTFIDYVTHSELQKYYKSAKLLVNTSVSEGFPNTFIEAAMNYTPILSLTVDPNGMLSRFKCGTCCKGEQKLFYETFKNYTENESKLKEDGENAFLYAEKHHQLNTAVERIDKIIRDVMNKRG